MVRLLRRSGRVYVTFSVYVPDELHNVVTELVSRGLYRTKSQLIVKSLVHYILEKHPEYRDRLKRVAEEYGVEV